MSTAAGAQIVRGNPRDGDYRNMNRM